MKLEPQFLHSYRSPSAKPGVSQVVLQVAQVVKGRSELRLPGNECSVCIFAFILGLKRATQKENNYLGRLGDSTHSATRIVGDT